MVFSSVPLYLDPPNWQQHSNQHLHNDQIQQHHLISQQHVQQQQQQQQPQLQQQQQQNQVVGSIGAQQIRANSMAERARLAKIPPPEGPQKCPRCDSTNTKFCYYNNYSLSQPRHFCKTCRRYWTRGGALRNVPVGGGCRRNKRSSSSSSNKSSSGGGATSAKSATTAANHMVSDPSRGINVNSLTGMINSGGGNSSNNPLSFMASLQNIAHLGGMGLNFNGGPINNINSNTTPLVGVAGDAGAGAAGAGYNNLEFPHHQQQIHHQFPNFLGGFEIPGSSAGGGGGGGGAGGLIYPQFQNVHHRNNINNSEDDQDQQHREQELTFNNDHMSSKGSSIITNMVTPVKMEDNNGQQQQQQQQQGLNIAKQLMMGISSSNDDDNNNNNSNITGNNSPFWGGNMSNTIGVTSMWTDLSGLNSSSTSHLL
ncbi:hypothetical protein RND81_01G010000 [Saponaria officinalis]|uniref:Dof zinc finger protein n=1 Tax=Saponaria officinalis TaxID=3572 RepID=A0AAW1NAS3_SAPOF